MAEKFFPFDAVEIDGVPDRIFYSEDWADAISKFFKNGVYPNPSDGLQALSLNSNMVVSIQPGAGFINGRSYQTDEVIEVALDTANANYNRKDIIVLRLDLTERDVKVLYRPGTASANPLAPELIRTSDIHELKLAEITVHSGTQVISQSDILDCRMDSSVCGYVDNTIHNVDTETIFNQYNQKWLEVLAKMNLDETTYDEWWLAFTTVANNSFNQKMNEIEGWYGQIKADVFDAKYFDFDNWAYRTQETKQTIFNEDGSITEQIVNKVSEEVLAIRTTTFNADGSIAEHLVVAKDNIDITKQTLFNEDGSVSEVIS